VIDGTLLLACIDLGNSIDQLTSVEIESDIGKTTTVTVTLIDS